MDINELKAKHVGIDLFLVESEDLPETFVLRKPTRMEVKRKEDELGKLQGSGKGLSVVLQNYLRPCIVAPEWPRCIEVFEEYPAIEDALLAKINELAGANISLSLKKA